MSQSERSKQGKSVIQKNHNNSGRVVRTTLSAYSGILPPPDELAKYNNAYDGCARDIVEMVKKQREARISNETKMVDQTCKSSSTGTLYGFILLMFVSSLIFIVAITRQIWEVLWVESIPLLTLIIDRIFAYIKRKDDLKAKQNIRINMNSNSANNSEPPNNVIDV